LPALRRIRREARFTETHSTREQWKEFQRAINPLGLWLEAEVASSSVMVAQDELHTAYALACTRANQPIVTKQMFGRTLKRLRPDLREAQRMIGGGRRWVYLGMGMKNGSREPLSQAEQFPGERSYSLESLDQGDFSSR
jgi:hypothetical protein